MGVKVKGKNIRGYWFKTALYNNGKLCCLQATKHDISTAF